MKTKLTFILFLVLFGFSQEKDSVKPNININPIFTVGVDVLNAGLSAFSDRKLFQGYVSSEIKKNLHAVLDVGFEKKYLSEKMVVMLLQTEFSEN